MNLAQCSKEIKFHDDKESFFTKLYYRWFETWLYNLYEYSWAYDLRWYLYHWWYKDHWIKTNLPIGYHDAAGLMEEALFTLVEDYISRDDEDAPSNVVIIPEIMDKIIAIIYFYRIRKPMLEKKYEDMLHETYKDVEIKFVPCEDRPEYSELKWENNSKYSDAERDEMQKEATALENSTYEETQKYLMMCVEIRMYLWT